MYYSDTNQAHVCLHIIRKFALLHIIKFTCSIDYFIPDLKTAFTPKKSFYFQYNGILSNYVNFI